MTLAALIHRVGVMRESAGPCWVRTSPGRIYATYHPDAPRGVTTCGVCGLVVVRGMTDWWNR